MVCNVGVAILLWFPNKYCILGMGRIIDFRPAYSYQGFSCIIDRFLGVSYHIEFDVLISLFIDPGENCHAYYTMFTVQSSFAGSNFTLIQECLGLIKFIKARCLHILFPPNNHIRNQFNSPDLSPTAIAWKPFEILSEL